MVDKVFGDFFLVPIRKIGFQNIISKPICDANLNPEETIACCKNFVEEFESIIKRFVSFFGGF